jgi:hypothetical protein
MNRSLKAIALLGATLSSSCSSSSPSEPTGNDGGTSGKGGEYGETVGGSAGAFDPTTLGGASSRGLGGAGNTTPLGGAGSTTAATSTAGASGAAVGASCAEEGDGTTTLRFANRCAKAVTFRGSDDVSGSLSSGEVACIDIGTATEALSSKRYWGWIGTDPGSGRHTLAEFTFNTDFYDMDWYNISHVDAHNLPLAIVPLARSKCRKLSCPQDFLAGCPEVGRYRNAQGEVVSCVSPERDNPKSAVVLVFEGCDDAYAWSGDDQAGNDVSPMVGCEVEDFEIVFCPEGK